MKRKNKISLPPRLVGLSLSAMVLLVGSLSLVASIDQDAKINIENPVPYDESSLIGRVWGESGPMSNPNILLPSENGGLYAVDGYVNQYGYFALTVQGPDGTASLMKDSHIRHVRIVTSDHVDSISYVIQGPVQHRFHFERVSINVWDLNLSSVDVLLIRGAEIGYEDLLFSMTVPPGSDTVLEFSISFYGAGTPIYYAEVMVGAVGLVLVMIGLFVSPFLSGNDVARWVASSKRRMAKVRGGR